MQNKVNYKYPLILIILFVISICSGDKIFFVTSTQSTDRTKQIKKQISPYVNISYFDHHFREAADSIGWDWKLIAAIGYIESRFDSTAQSSVGATGVMQVMPRTLRQFGIPDSLHMEPRSNIMAAVSLLKELDYRFRRIKDSVERANFVLASYNAGIGHISDAMRLAEKYGYDKNKWENSVDSFLIRKSYPEYYNDSLCKNGQFKDWKQTLQFVKKVKRTWQKYNRLQYIYSDSIHKIARSDSMVLIMPH